MNTARVFFWKLINSPSSSRLQLNLFDERASYCKSCIWELLPADNRFHRKVYQTELLTIGRMTNKISRYKMFPNRDRPQPRLRATTGMQVMAQITSCYTSLMLTCDNSGFLWGQQEQDTLLTSKIQSLTMAKFPYISRSLLNLDWL